MKIAEIESCAIKRLRRPRVWIEALAFRPDNRPAVRRYGL